jgi:hypothetical protein
MATLIEDTYTPVYPSNVSVELGIKEFVSKFYEISDRPDMDDAWVAFFADGATLIMGNDVGHGKEGELLTTPRECSQATNKMPCLEISNASGRGCGMPWRHGSIQLPKHSLPCSRVTRTIAARRN